MKVYKDNVRQLLLLIKMNNIINNDIICMYMDTYVYKNVYDIQFNLS